MKVGDIAKVVRGEFVERIGYNETVESAKAKLQTYMVGSSQKDVESIIKHNFPFADWTDCEKIFEILGRSYNRNMLRYGGPERKIFTTYDPTYDGRLVKLTKRIVRQTGKYCSGDSECPASIGNMRSHVLFEVLLMPTDYDPLKQGVESLYGHMHMYGYSSSDRKGFYDKKEDVVFSDLIEKCHLEYIHTP